MSYTNDVKISVIIPVFNVEKYIGECIKSVIDQTFSSWELILIDDGSTDHSYEICRLLSEQDNRIRLFKTKNKGACSARNLGIDNAQGEYICFVDSDDILRNDALMVLYNGIRDNADYAFCCASCQSISAEGDKTSRPFLIAEGPIYGKTLLNKVLHYQTLCSIWAKLYKKEFIGNTRFQEGLKRGEDISFLSKLLIKNGDCYGLMINEAIYLYRILSNSISHGANQEEKIKDMISHMETLLPYVTAKYPELKKALGYNIIINAIECFGYQGVLKSSKKWQKQLLEKYVSDADITGRIKLITNIILKQPKLLADFYISLVFLPNNIKRLIKKIRAICIGQ